MQILQKCLMFKKKHFSKENEILKLNKWVFLNILKIDQFKEKKHFFSAKIV